MGKDIYLNLSRIGKNGSGLAAYSEKFTTCIRKRFSNVYLIKSFPDQIKSTRQKEVIVPGIVTNTSRVSLFRPIFWYLYSHFLFPRLHGRIISTTHHIVPGVQHQVVTIHDLRPYFYPDSIVQKIYFRYMLPRNIKKIDGILTVSEATKSLLIQYYGCASEKIHVVPNCVDVSRFSPSEALRSGVPYLLMVGATWRHKNAHEVLGMFKAWSSQYTLKIVAGKGNYVESLKEMVRRLQIHEKVEFIDRYVDEVELASLYKNAVALVYPSLMEGFGIPPIEAMACGVPVIVSDIEVFREVCGDIPIYVKIGNEQSWHTAFKMLNDRALIEKKITAGLKQAQIYDEQHMEDAALKAIGEIWPDLVASHA